MKKDKQVKHPQPDEMRAGYERADFGKMVRGKHYKQVMENSNVVVLNPEIAKAFPNANAVNDALGQLLSLAKSTAKSAPRTRSKVRAS
jgi:hypothetical protein